MFTKAELREKAKQVRSLLEMDKISEKIIESIRSAEIYNLAQHIMIFYPLKDEVNLLPLLKDNKNFYLPKVEGDELVVCPYKEGDALVTSKFNTKEPVSKPVHPDILDIILIPALMVGRNFYRIGYGQGFYDRFLLKNTMGAIRIVPISSLLVKDEVPFDEYDAQFDIILDEL